MYTYAIKNLYGETKNPCAHAYFISLSSYTNCPQTLLQFPSTYTQLKLIITWRYLNYNYYHYYISFFLLFFLRFKGYQCETSSSISLITSRIFFFFLKIFNESISRKQTNQFAQDPQDTVVYLKYSDRRNALCGPKNNSAKYARISLPGLLNDNRTRTVSWPSIVRRRWFFVKMLYSFRRKICVSLCGDTTDHHGLRRAAK